MKGIYTDLINHKKEGNVIISLCISTGFLGGHVITLVNINDKYLTIKDPNRETIVKIKDKIEKESTIDDSF